MQHLKAENIAKEILDYQSDEPKLDHGDEFVSESLFLD